MNTDNTEFVIQGESLIQLSEAEARNFTDAFALAWIFTGVLASGLLVLNTNLYTLLGVAFSVALGGIWWILSNIKRR